MSDELRISTTFVPHLRTQFSRGNVVLLTGAGFSFDAVSGAGLRLPQVGELSRLLWEICYGKEPFDVTTQLQDIYDAAVQSNRAAVDRLLRVRLAVDPRACPVYYSSIVTMPWARIYTLNVDDLIDRVLAEARTPRAFRVASATSGLIADVEDSALSIVHLNGSLADVPDRITFGRSQYAYRAGADPFYSQLRHDLASRPVVFIGSTLEEGPFWQHLAMRGPKPSRGDRELRPRSYLVSPKLNKSKQALLSQYNIEWLEMTAEEFARNILAQLDDARAEGNALLQRRFSEETRGPQIARVAEINEGKKEPTEYLLGAEPQWADAKQRRIAHRGCVDEIVREIDSIRAASSVKKFLVVTGTAGTGKSSAMMMAALRLEADNLPCGWIDGTDRVDLQGMRKTLEAEQGLGALFITDADLYDKRFSRFVRDAIEAVPRLIVICECRSSRVDRIIDKVELRGILPVEYSIPYLEDRDIDAILEVLDRENRLGVLKGLNPADRHRVFEAEAGRQMLVAMYKATHGKEFKEKAVDELRGLDSSQRFIYGLVSVAHAHRYYLTKDEIAIASGDDIEEWPRALDALTKRKIILIGGGDIYRARHREIAQFVYDDLVREGRIADVIKGMLKIGGTKCNVNSVRTSRNSRLLATFVSHKLVKRTVGVPVGRQIYGEFEYLLEWDHHYWLHRGALELESGNLALAENFLNQAKGIEPADVFVDNELAYLNLKKANAAPQDSRSELLVRDALRTLEAVALRRPDQRARAYHIMGSQGLVWAQQSAMLDEEKHRFLTKLKVYVHSALDEDNDDMLSNLEAQLQREILSIAVSRPR